MAVDLQEGVLQNVGRVGVRGDAARQAEHASLIAPNHFLEGRIVPGRGARGERLVARLRGGDDLIDRGLSIFDRRLDAVGSSGVTSVIP